MKLHLLITVFVLTLPLPVVADADQKFTKFAGFELNTNVTLLAVEKQIGPANIIESGEAGAYEAKICYLTPIGTVSFLSSEMGGHDHELLGFSIAVTTQEAEKTCSKPKQNSIPTELAIGGIRLGISRNYFSTAVAGDVRWSGDVGIHNINYTKPLTPDEIKRVEGFWPDIAERPYADVMISIIGTFKNNILVEFQVWKVSTI